MILSLILFKRYFSDTHGVRKKVMTPGAIGVTIFGPLTAHVSSKRNTVAAFFAHFLLGMSLVCHTALSPALSLESFPDHTDDMSFF